MLEELRTILEAESEARRQFDQAHREAARLVQEAEEAARTLTRAAHAARAGDAHAVEEDLVVAAQREAQRMRHAARAEAATMATRAAPGSSASPRLWMPSEDNAILRRGAQPCPHTLGMCAPTKQPIRRW